MNAMDGAKTPLSLWVPTKSASPDRRNTAALDTTKCHAQVTVSGRVTSWHQCDRTPKTERPVREGLSGDVIVIRPVCGVHARVFDKAMEQDEAHTVARAAAAALQSQFTTLTQGIPWGDRCYLTASTAPRVSLPLEIFKMLIESWRPALEPAKGDLVAFIVRDGTRIRHQGTGNVKSIDAKGVHLTDGASGKRFVVPRVDVRIKVIKENR